MSTSALVSLEEYLNTSYDPDMDFVDGVLVRRNVGTQLHGLVQKLLTVYFSRFEKSHGIQVFPAVRLLVDAASGRYRVPDVLILATPYRKGKTITDVPVVGIEIKSPDDKFDDIFGRCVDYEKLGVPNIIVMAPDNRDAWRFEHRQLLAAPRSLNLGHATIEFPADELFAKLDE